MMYHLGALVCKVAVLFLTKLRLLAVLLQVLLKQMLAQSQLPSGARLNAIAQSRAEAKLKSGALSQSLVMISTLVLHNASGLGGYSCSM